MIGRVKEEKKERERRKEKEEKGEEKRWLHKDQVC